MFMTSETARCCETLVAANETTRRHILEANNHQSRRLENLKFSLQVAKFQPKFWSQISLSAWKLRLVRCYADTCKIQGQWTPFPLTPMSAAECEQRDKAHPHNALRFASLPEWKSLWIWRYYACRNDNIIWVVECEYSPSPPCLQNTFLLTCGPIYIWFSQDISSPQDSNSQTSITMRSKHFAHLILLVPTILVSSDEQHYLFRTSLYAYSVLLSLSRPLIQTSFLGTLVSQTFNLPF